MPAGGDGYGNTGVCEPVLTGPYEVLLLAEPATGPSGSPRDSNSVVGPTAAVVV